MARLIVIGSAGAGKTTQTFRLADRLGCTPICTGEILRQAIASGSEFGAKVRQYVNAGEFVPDHLMISLIKSLLTTPDFNPAWVLEGYPRTAFQAEELDFLLDDLHQSVDFAIYLEVPEEILIQRSLSRAEQDDTAAIIQKRLELFTERTKLLLDYYEHQEKLITIDGSMNAAFVTEAIRKALG